MLLFPFHDSMAVGTHHITFFYFLKQSTKAFRNVTTYVKTFINWISVMKIQNPRIGIATILAAKLFSYLTKMLTLLS